jgi:hypothetical protein
VSRADEVDPLLRASKGFHPKREFKPLFSQKVAPSMSKATKQALLRASYQAATNLLVVAYLV